MIGREAFKIFDCDKDGYVDMNEFKKVTLLLFFLLLFLLPGQVSVMLGSIMNMQEIEELMAEADVVSKLCTK